MSELQVVEAGAVKFVDEVKTEVEKVVAKVEPVAKKAIVTLTDSEKLALAEAETAYLKASMEIQRLTKTTEEQAKVYQNAVDGFLKKYVLDKSEYIFDGVKKACTLIEKKL